MNLIACKTTMLNLYLRKRKRVLKSFILAVVLFIFVFFFYSLFRFLALRLFGHDVFRQDLIILALSVFLVSILYKPMDYLILLLLKDVLFRSAARDHSTLAQLSKLLAGVLDAAELANLIVNTFGEVLEMRMASVLLYDKSKGVCQIRSAYGLKPNLWRNLEVNPNSLLLELLRARKEPLERERIIHSFSWREANQLTQEFEQLHASCVIPLFYESELVGSINLMPKAGIKSFSSQEIRSFSDFSREAALAFRNAARFEELKGSNQELMKIQSGFLHAAQHSAIAHLATGIAHEIHNPLTIISGKAQVLLLKRDKIAFDAQVEEVLKTIVKQTKRAADITRKLLTFSESNQLVREPVDFETVVNDTIALLSYQVSLEQIQVIKRFEQPIPKLNGNVGELREAFLSLFLNAVQAIGTKGVVQVVIRYRKQDQMIELRVSDSGPGISEADLPKVFYPFFSTRPGSTGLGLFVTQQIIHRYQGSIRVESRAREGTTFIVELPCLEDPTNSSQSRQQIKSVHKEGGPAAHQKEHKALSEGQVLSAKGVFGATGII